MLELNESNFEKEVLQSKKPVIVDFWAEWCQPCRKLSPILEELSGEMDNVKFAKLNTESGINIAREYDVVSIPCLIIFNNGRELNRIIGLSPKEDIKNKINVVLTE